MFSPNPLLYRPNWSCHCQCNLHSLQLSWVAGFALVSCIRQSHSGPSLDSCSMKLARWLLSVLVHYVIIMFFIKVTCIKNKADISLFYSISCSAENQPCKLIQIRTDCKILIPSPSNHALVFCCMCDKHWSKIKTEANKNWLDTKMITYNMTESRSCIYHTRLKKHQKWKRI